MAVAAAIELGGNSGFDMAVGGGPWASEQTTNDLEAVSDEKLDKFDLAELSSTDRGQYGDQQIARAINREGIWFPRD